MGESDAIPRDRSKLMETHLRVDKRWSMSESNGSQALVTGSIVQLVNYACNYGCATKCSPRTYCGRKSFLYLILTHEWI